MVLSSKVTPDFPRIQSVAPKFTILMHVCPFPWGFCLIILLLLKMVQLFIPILVLPFSILFLNVSGNTLCVLLSSFSIECLAQLLLL